MANGTSTPSYWPSYQQDYPSTYQGSYRYDPYLWYLQGASPAYQYDPEAIMAKAPFGAPPEENVWIGREYAQMPGQGPAAFKPSARYPTYEAQVAEYKKQQGMQSYEDYRAAGGQLPYELWQLEAIYKFPGRKGRAIPPALEQASREFTMRNFYRGLSALQQQFGLYQPGGIMEQAALKQYQTTKQQDLARMQQGAVSAGMAGTTPATNAPMAYEQQVGRNYMLNLYSQLAELAGGSLGQQANYMTQWQGSYQPPPAPVKKKKKSSGIGGVLGGIAGSFLGPIGSAAGAYAGSKLFSDKKLKKDFRPITDALSKIKQLSGQTYNFVFNPSDKRDAGLIAQELEAVLPEAVDEINGLKYIKPNAIFALIIEAIKELTNKEK